tara:strand:- start:715 stop:1572 length:858 start_codon:yes stop_codon:yes gene_type:complete
MKILVTGSYGQLGRSLFNHLNSNIEVFWTGRNIPFDGNGFYLDICDRINLKELISLNEPDIIINLAALTNVDFCEKNLDLAREINTNGVRNICDAFKGKIVQLSTDYVFDGKNGPYLEEDEVFPLSVYGKTKLEAEKIVMSHNSDNLIIRGNVLYDNCIGSRASFLNWVVQSLREKTPINVVDDQINNPTWAKSMAKIIGLCVEKEISGIYHWGDAEFVSRYKFAKMIAKHYNLETKLINPKSTKEIGQVAPRPLKSGLLSEKIVKILDINQPSINGCLNQILPK